MSAGMARGDSVTVHQPPHGLRGLPGEQFDVAEPDPAAPVEVFYQLPGERNGPWEALPDWATRRHSRNLVLGKHGINEFVSVQRIDQFDLIRA